MRSFCFIPEGGERFLFQENEFNEDKFNSNNKRAITRFKGVPVPNHQRQSTYEAVLFHELQTWLLSSPVSFSDLSLKIWLYENFYAFNTSRRFVAELFDSVRLDLGKKEIDDSVMQVAKEKALSPTGFDGPLKDKIKELNKVLLKIKNKQVVDCYPHYFLDAPIPAMKKFYNKLQVKGNDQRADIYLQANHAPSDLLAHVRACEDAFCSLNSDECERTHAINNNVTDEVLRYVDIYKDPKEKSLFYGGFASGLLLRDLHIIQRLIEKGYSEFKFLFLDKTYATWIRAMQGESLTDFEAIGVAMVNQAFQEFASWVMMNVNSKTCIEFYIFSDVNKATQFLATHSEKLTFLVGQDYFAPEFKHLNPKFATKEAHRDFMQLAKSNPRCAFFESIKDVGNIYLHTGYITHNSEYKPLCTTVHPARDSLSYVYSVRSLGFFVQGVNDSPITKDDATIKPKTFEFKNDGFKKLT